MPDIIQLLPDAVANQIAAGEVIQRPASAVKELLENAIDAGADQIDLVIKDAGKTLIQVTDNGSGMSETDLRMAFERHATSKINSVNDLFKIRTMGFRGEALASIAAIAQLEVKTKLADQELGSCIIIEGSQVKSQEFCQCPAGTTIMLKNLFFNVPARRKFLKADTVEMRHIMEEFQRVALAHPDLSFNFYNEKKVVFQLRPSPLKQRIVAIFGQNHNKKLLPVEQKLENLSITGFVGKPEFARKIRGEQYFFVNNRFMRHAYLNHAVDNAFEQLVPDKSHPSYFIYIDIDPQEIDINIHPTKTEIKFQDEKMMYAVLRSAVKTSLGKFNLTPGFDFETEEAFDIKMPGKDTIIHPPTVKINPSYNPFDNQNEQSARIERNRQNWEQLYPESSNHVSKPNQVFKGEKGPFHEDESIPSIENHERYFQLHNAFILTQVKSGLMIIDQQLAHERILYERYLQLLGKQNALTQQELFPQTLSLPPAEAELLNELLPELALLGFNIVPDNEKAFRYAILGTPAGIEQTDIPKLIEGIVENYRGNMLEVSLDKRKNLARSVAKNLSVKRGKKLHDHEMKAILETLFICQMPELSPDGKKIIRIIPLHQLMDAKNSFAEQNRSLNS
jgi:DNA mismatch repair protein MutL